MEIAPHGILEDIGAEIGFTATTALVGWFAGQTLWVPRVFKPDHPLCKIIGEKAALRLINAFTGESLSIPLHHHYSVRDRKIVQMVLAGKSEDKIAGHLRITIKRFRQLKSRLEKAGLLEPPEELAGKIRSKNAREKAGAKMPGGMPGEVMDATIELDGMRTTGLLARQVMAAADTGIKGPRKR